jgi:hypothetical protein
MELTRARLLIRLDGHRRRLAACPHDGEEVHVIHRSSVAAAAAVLLCTGQAWGYALNAHVAICQHVLDTLSSGGMALEKAGIPDLTPRQANTHDNRSPDPAKGVVGGKAGSGPMKAIVPDAQIKRIVLAYPAQFRAGCGAPDAFPFFGNTDPSHSYGWDPVGIAETLHAHAQTDAEKSWVYGYFAHLAMDSAVHAFANTYSGLSMQRHGKLKGTLRPQVWDTFEPTNFLAHIAAETWLNQYFVYAAKPQSYAIETPKEFVERMFLSPGSPIVRHFSQILENWRPENKAKLGKDYDIQTEIGGEKPGVLGTYFHRMLQHFHRFEEIHTEAMYRWRGHASYYAKKDCLNDNFRHFLANTMSRWHRGRVEKIRNVYRGWRDSTLAVQTVVSARGSAADLAKGLKPFKDAISAYLSIDLLKAIELPPALQAAIAVVRGVVEPIEQAVKAALLAFAKAAIEPFMKDIEELAQVAMGAYIDKFMDRAARDHARKLLAEAGLVANPAASEPGAAKATNAGIDGADADRKKLLRYPFYRNAWMAVFHILKDPFSLRNLPSADFSNGGRCTDFFQNSRRDPDGQYTAILKGNDPLYNATTETCHTPNLTRLADTSFVTVDHDARYEHLAKESSGFLESEELNAFLVKVKSVVAGAGSWLKDKLGAVLPPAIDGAIDRVGKSLASFGQWLSSVGKAICGGTIGDKIKAFLLNFINAHLPGIHQCIRDDLTIQKALAGLRPVQTCEIAEALLRERCTGPFLTSLIEGALPIYARPAEMNVLEDPGVIRVFRGVQLALDKVEIAVPSGDDHRPSVEVQMSLSKDGEDQAIRFGAKLAAQVLTKCGKNESAFYIRPYIDDISLSGGLPEWLVKMVGGLALQTVKFKSWKPELNRWWKPFTAGASAPAKPAAPAIPAATCTLKVGGVP